MNEKTKLNIIYFPLYLLFHSIALLPFWVLYRISDFLFFIIYYVVGYRLKVTTKNINESFPNKTEGEKKKIIRDFYRHFTDYFIETIKLLHISDAEIKRRMVFENISIVDDCLSRGRSIVIYAGHYANWEYLTSIPLWSSAPIESRVFGQVYRPLRNEWFDDFFMGIRTRHSQCFKMRSTLRDLLKIKKSGKNSITGFISDQHPRGNDSDHVIRFLNHDTAFITGSEQLARKLDLDTLYFDIQKVKRGYYKATIKVVFLNPNETKEFAITDKYASMLQTTIERDPALWLWTHNRWKNKVKPLSTQG